MENHACMDCVLCLFIFALDLNSFHFYEPLYIGTFFLWVLARPTSRIVELYIFVQFVLYYRLYYDTCRTHYQDIVMLCQYFYIGGKVTGPIWLHLCDKASKSLECKSHKSGHMMLFSSMIFIFAYVQKTNVQWRITSRG